MFNKNEFMAQLVRNGKTIKDIAGYLGINEATVYRKINADGNFTRREINKLIQFLDIDDPKFIFFADELA